MKKKIISGIIICIILLSSYLIVNATNNVTKLQPNKQSNEVTVTFKVSKVDDGLDALSGKIIYDKSKLEFVKIEKGNSKWQEPSYNDNSGKFTLLINSETIYEACDAIKVTFKAKENASGNTSVTISEIVGATSKDETITFKDVTTTVDIGNDSDDENNNEIDDNTNSVDDGNNNETDDNTNSVDDDNNETDDNTNSIDGDNSNSENSNTVDDDNQNITDEDDSNNVNDESTENDISNNLYGNNDNVADGKLPQTGEGISGYIVIAVAIILIIISINLILKQKKGK